MLQDLQLAVWQGEDFQISSTWEVVKEMYGQKVIVPETAGTWHLLGCRADYDPANLQGVGLNCYQVGLIGLQMFPIESN